MYQTHEIRHCRGHVEVFDGANQFVLSADNEHEAYEELLTFIAEKYAQKSH